MTLVFITTTVSFQHQYGVSNFFLPKIIFRLWWGDFGLLWMNFVVTFLTESYLKYKPNEVRSDTISLRDVVKISKNVWETVSACNGLISITEHYGHVSTLQREREAWITKTVLAWFSIALYSKYGYILKTNYLKNMLSFNWLRPLPWSSQWKLDTWKGLNTLKQGLKCVSDLLRWPLTFIRIRVDGSPFSVGQQNSRIK